MPVTVVIGMAALRRTWRWISLRPGIPRLTAVCTCSRRPSSRTDARVTLATIASEETARAIAGSVKCRTLSRKPVPFPRAGNQPSFTANTRMSTIAATNAGMAAETAVVTSVPVSSFPGRRPETRPRPIPSATMIRDAYRTSPAVVQIRDAISVDTFSRSVIEIPRLPCSTLSSQYQYCATNGALRWYRCSRMRTLLGGSDRPPDSAAIGFPGARYTAAKMTKLATSRLISSMASRRATNLQRIASAGPAEAVGPGGEHVGERRHRPGQLAAQHELLRRLHIRDPRQLLHGELLRPHHERRPLVRVGRAPRLLQRRDDLRVVEVVVVLRAAGQVERGEHRRRVGVVAVVHRQEPVDALPGLGVDEEVDVVLGGHRFEDCFEADRLRRCLVGARVRGNVRELAGRADRDRLSGGTGFLHELLGLGNVLADHGRASVG